MGLFSRKKVCLKHEWRTEYGKCVCNICGEMRDACTFCGSGEQTLLGSDNYGECDYSSYGGGVDDFIVSVYRCDNCGRIFTVTRGSVCGDDSDMIRETLERYS